MSEQAEVEQQIREALAVETSEVLLSNRLFAPDGLFYRLAETEAERRVVAQSTLFREAQRRLSELRRVRSKLAGTPQQNGRTFAIVIDLDPAALQTNYHALGDDPDLEICRVLQRHGFTWQQGSVYLGGEAVTSVTCVMAAMDLAQSLPWFAASVRDIRMLRIEELNDLMPAVKHAVGHHRRGQA